MNVKEEQQVRETPVNPFAFFPGVASRIAGLGGNTPGHDHNYVFHTPYLEAAPGPSRFIVQFHKLSARLGSLWLRVHMLPMEPGSRAVMVNSDRIQLNRLIQNGERCEIAFEGFIGMSFALYAGIQGETDAHAEDVQVWFDRPRELGETPDIAVDVRSTRFGSDKPTPVALMLSNKRPSLAAPTSQIATAAQISQPIVDRWQCSINLSNDPIRRWQHLFILQALDHYGMMQKDARGLGIGCGHSPLPEALRCIPMSISTLEPFGSSTEELTDPRIHRAPIGDLPAELINFDFLWSEDAWRDLSNPNEAIRYCERLMATVRPKGLVVHTGGFLLNGESPDERLLLSRSDIERLLLVLISRGHEVSQFRFCRHDALKESDGRNGAVGLIIRKANSWI